MTEIIACLEERYGRNRLEKIEELVLDLIGFRDDDYEDEGDFLHYMEELQRRKEDIKVTDREWNTVWMLKKAQKRKGMNDFKYHALRDVLKVKGDKTKEFGEKYNEVRMQNSRGKVNNAQFSTVEEKSQHDTMYMGMESMARKRSQETRNRRVSY